GLRETEHSLGFQPARPPNRGWAPDGWPGTGEGAGPAKSLRTGKIEKAPNWASLALAPAHQHRYAPCWRAPSASAPGRLTLALRVRTVTVAGRHGGRDLPGS